MPESLLKINKLAIIGVGLIGGSLAIALRNAGITSHIVGCGRNEDNLQRGVELGVIDAYSTSVEKAVANADMVFVAVPLGAMRKVFEQMKGHLADHATVTDGGSSKASVVADWLSVFGSEEQFVAGHPIAGTENSGVEAALPDLYRNRRIILTPTGATDTDRLQRVQRMWEACGAEVSEMSVEHHDHVLAATSHLPHVIAFGLVETLAQLDEHTEIFKYAAGGFRDFSRIASSNPEMWRDICLNNADALSGVLSKYISDLQHLAGLIESHDSDELLRVFQIAKQARDDYVDGIS